MFTLLDNGHDRNCQGRTRREFLRVGGLGLLGGLTLPDLLRARAQAAESGQTVKDRSVVLLFLQGGPSHIEFFDPKMSAPAEVRSITGDYLLAFMTSGLACLLASLLVLRVTRSEPALVPAQ